MREGTVKRNVVYLDENNNIVNNLNNSIISVPAFFIDKTTGTLHAWGERDLVLEKYNIFVNAFEKVGMKEEALDYVFLSMETNTLSNEQKCYVLKRLIEFSATSFHIEVVKHIVNNTLNKWLNEEMEEVKLDLRDSA